MRDEQEVPRSAIDLEVCRLSSEPLALFALSNLAHTCKPRQVLRNVGLDVAVEKDEWRLRRLSRLPTWQRLAGPNVRGRSETA